MKMETRTWEDVDSLAELEIAVAHEHYRDRGGGEHVAEHLAEAFDAPIYTGMIRSDQPLPKDKDIEIHPLFDGLLSEIMDRSTFVRDFVYFLGWEYSPVLAEYDVIIQSGNNPGWYVPREDQVVIRYAHTTPRAAYDQFQEKGDSWLIRAYSKAARIFYNTVTSFPDAYITNSEVVGYRHEKYLGITPEEIVYPPVPTDTYGPRETEDFYLSYSRLSPNKRFDEIIEAFKKHPDKHLKIGGDGQLRDELEKQAEGQDNIEFVGYMSEEEKRDLAGRAKALVYAAKDEDFGMVPIEAYASGTPVIGVDEGYTSFQVMDGADGILFDRGELSEALDRFEKTEMVPKAEMMEKAEQYSVENFNQQIRDVTRRVIKEVPTV